MRGIREARATVDRANPKFLSGLREYITHPGLTPNFSLALALAHVYLLFPFHKSLSYFVHCPPYTYTRGERTLSVSAAFLPA